MKQTRVDMVSSNDPKFNGDNGFISDEFDGDESDDAWSSIDYSRRRTHGNHTFNTETTVVHISTARPRHRPPTRDDDTTTLRHDSQRSIIKFFPVPKRMMNTPLSRFGRMFLFHFVTEVWDHHVSTRMGILLLVLALLCQIINLLFMTISIFPHLFFLACTTYLYLFQIEKNDDIVHTSWRAVSNVSKASLNAAFVCLETLDGNGMKYIMLLLLVIPIVLRMCTIVFLARVVSDTGWGGGGPYERIMSSLKVLFLEMLFLVPVHYNIRINNGNNIGTNASSQNRSDLPMGNSSSNDKNHLPSAVKIGRITITKKETTTLSECHIHTLIYLYVSALFAAMTFMMESAPIQLAGNFLFASGTILLLSPFQRSGGNGGSSVLSELLQSTMRLALLDALECVGEDIAEDKMLKLAMLRWLVDYWASPLPPLSSAIRPLPPDEEYNNNSTHADVPPIQSNSSAHQAEVSEEGGISWYALGTMLGMTTAQMHQKVPRAPSVNNECYDINSSVRNLESMLASLDVNERAKPAVMSYKVAVEECPPSRRIAIIIASMQRCPALFSLVCLYMNGSMHRVRIAITLSPLIIFELMRMKQWFNSCHRAMMVNGQHDTVSVWSPDEMEPMVIILSRDNYSSNNPGPTLQVWGNLGGSVVALQSGLTAMRCIQTVHPVTDVAFDVICLTKFAYKISQREMSHKLGSLVLNIWQIYKDKSSLTISPSRGRDEGKNRLSGANFNNAQITANEIQTIVQERKQENNAFTRIINGTKVVMGRGWLWYQDEHQDLKQNISGASDRINVIADDAIAKAVKYNNIGIDTSQMKMGGTEQKLIKHSKDKQIDAPDYTTKLNEGVVPSQNILDGIQTYFAKGDEEHVVIKVYLKNRNIALMLREIFQDKRYKESAEKCKDLEVKHFSVENINTKLVDRTDWAVEKQQEECSAIKDDAKITSHDNCNIDISGMINELEVEDLSDILDIQHEQNRESAVMLKKFELKTFSVCLNQGSVDEIDKAKNEQDKKYMASKDYFKIKSHTDNESRELTSMIKELEVNDLSTFLIKPRDSNRESAGILEDFEVKDLAVEGLNQSSADTRIEALSDEKNRETITILKEFKGSDLSHASNNVEPNKLFDPIEDESSYISDDSSWTEIEYIDLDINKSQESSVHNLQERNTFPNKINVHDELAVTEENTNGSKLKMIGAGLTGLGTAIIRIVTDKSSDRERKIASKSTQKLKH